MSYRILQLYPNLMNLYGDYANISLLSRYMAEEGFTHEILSSDSETDFSSYDMIYIGSGTERSSLRALELIAPCVDSLKDFLQKGGRLLLTGTAADLLRDCVEDDTFGSVPGLGLISGKVSRSHSKRILGDVLYHCPAVQATVLGFVNTCSMPEASSTPLFETGAELNPSGLTTEGILTENILATGLAGPLLIKNPKLCRWYLDAIYQGVGFRPETSADMSVQQAAYDAACRELLELRKKM